MSIGLTNYVDNCKASYSRSIIGIMKEAKYPIFAKMFSELLRKSNISQYRLAEDTELRAPNILKVAKGERRPTDEFLAQVAAYKPLNVDILDLLAWRVMDEYSPEVLSRICQSIIGEASSEFSKRKLK